MTARGDRNYRDVHFLANIEGIFGSLLQILGHFGNSIPDILFFFWRQHFSPSDNLSFPVSDFGLINPIALDKIFTVFVLINKEITTEIQAR